MDCKNWRLIKLGITSLIALFNQSTTRNEKLIVYPSSSLLLDSFILLKTLYSTSVVVCFAYLNNFQQHFVVSQKGHSLIECNQQPATEYFLKNKSITNSKSKVNLLYQFLTQIIKYSLKAHSRFVPSLCIYMLALVCLFLWVLCVIYQKRVLAKLMPSV